MINNFELISNFIEDDLKDQFYHLSIIRRRKDHPDLAHATRVIKVYYVPNKKYLEKHKSEIITLCNEFKARAYINIAPKSMKKLTTKAALHLISRIDMGDFKNTYKCFNSIAGELKSEDPRWIVDLDEVTDKGIQEITDFIFNELHGEIYCKIPTLNGCHLITSPFRLDFFKKRYFDIDVHKNNPTLLYCPDIPDESYCINKVKEFFNYFHDINIIPVASLYKNWNGAVYINEDLTNEIINYYKEREFSKEEIIWIKEWEDSIRSDKWIWNFELNDATNLPLESGIIKCVDKDLNINIFDVD